MTSKSKHLGRIISFSILSIIICLSQKYRYFSLYISSVLDKHQFNSFMKYILSIFIITLMADCSLLGQNINMPPDDVTKILCKKWQIDYALMNGMKVYIANGATQVNYKFDADGLFYLTNNDPNKKSKGSWSYETNKKSIKLTINGTSNTNIISLNENELVMMADTKQATPDDPSNIKMVFKPGK
jgi:Lipocalin-like domain